jgi:hypothetical protein
MICDFCNAANPIWRFSARLLVLDYGPVVTASDADWSACDACRNLILAGGRTGPADRAMLFAPVIPGLPESEVRELRRWAQGLFFAHRVPCEPTPIALLKELPLAVWAPRPSFIPRETPLCFLHFCILQNPASAWCGPPAGQSRRTRRKTMIRKTEQFLAALRAARRVSTPLVSIRSADPASAIALTTQPERRCRQPVPFIVGQHDRPFGGKRPGQENARLDHRGTQTRDCGIG